MNDEEYFDKLKKEAAKGEKNVQDAPVRTRAEKTFKKYSFTVYRGMNPIISWVIFFYFIAWFMLVLIVVAGDVKVDMVLISQIMAGIAGGFILIIFLGYLRFRGWQERLPFRLEGWTELVQTHKMHRSKYYRKIKFTIVTKPHISEPNLQHLKSAQQIMMNNLNRRIVKDSFNDGRQKWVQIQPNACTGTINNVALGRIKTNLQHDFSEIYDRTGCFEKIEIEFDKKGFVYEPPSTDTMS